MDENSIIITTPSIGQADQIKYLTESAGPNHIAYMAFEVNLEAAKFGMIEKTLLHMLKRHESLRTIFPAIDGDIKQVILPYESNLFKIEYVELQVQQDFLTVKNELYKKANSIISNLGKGPLFKAILLKNTDGSYFFSMLINHLICDAWSLKIVESELFEIYTAYTNGIEPDLLPLTFQLRDYCEELNANFSNNKINFRNFWTRQLKGFDEMFAIEDFYSTYAKRKNSSFLKAPRTDNSQILTDILNDEESFALTSYIPDQDFLQLKDLAQQQHSTLSALLYTSFHLLISYYAGKDKVLLAALIADRGSIDKNHLIGCLLGGIYLPLKSSGDVSIHEFIDEVSTTLLDGIQHVIYDHSYLELDDHNLRTSCDMYINYITTSQPLAIDDQQHYNRKHTPDDGIYYALNCRLNEYTNGLTITWRYNKTLFQKEVIEDLVDCHEAIITQLISKENTSVKDIISSLF